MGSKIAQHTADSPGTLREPEKQFWQDRKRRLKRGLSRSGYVAAIVVNIALLYVFNSLLDWNVPFLTESFIAALGVINLSLLAAIVANALFLVYDAAWFRHAVRIVQNVIAFAAAYTLFVIFPFDFGDPTLDLLARIGLIVVLAGIAAGTLVEAFKLLLGRD